MVIAPADISVVVGALRKRDIQIAVPGPNYRACKALLQVHRLLLEKRGE